MHTVWPVYDYAHYGMKTYMIHNMNESFIGQISTG